jgi:energy-coupling factor transporter ATP-binding protein EcfA2
MQTSANIDDAKKTFDSLAQQWATSLAEIETEQDTRFQIIDLILTQVLGWSRKEIKTEKHTESGYIDYLLHAESRGRLVVEAKKVSRLLIDTRNPKMNYYQINGTALKSAQDGINQARKYCLQTGVSFAALTSGIEWIAFLAVRTDGKAPEQGKAIAFPNLDAISDNFAVFFDLFSKHGILNQLYKVRVNEAEGLRIDYFQKLYQVIEKNQIRLLQKPKFATDIEQIFKEFFSTMSGDNDPEMLAKCFVETKESRHTDAGLQKITGNLLNQIEVVSSESGEELEERIRYAVQTKRGEFVLIIGNKGAGKSTFIDRFFNLVLDLDLRRKCLVVRIDLADSSGDMDSIAGWLVQRLKNKLESQLFKNSTPSYEQLQGVFYSEYQRWMFGEHKYLYEKDKQAFKIKFGEHIATLINEQPDKYVRYLLKDSIKSRALMPCLVFDNTDHFPQPFQERVFQFAQSVHRTVFSFIICPITDRTIWQLSKEGPFQSYPTKSFYLPVPSTKEILNRRIIFINEKIEEDKDEKAEYFLKRGIRLSISDIKTFAACIENILVNTDYVSRMIGSLSNHDIRRSLRISERIVTSPFIALEDLVKTYVSGKNLYVPRYQIKKALLLGNYNHFNSSDSEFILNLFTMKPEQVTSPLFKLSLLRLLVDKDNQSKDFEEAYVTVEDTINYFEPAGVAGSVITSHLQELLEFRLIQPYDPTDLHIYEDQRLRISYSGRIHSQFCLNDDSYVSHVALVTPVRSYELVSDVRDVMQSKLSRTEWLQIISTFMKYSLDQDKLFISLPKRPSYDRQSQLRHELRMKWVISPLGEDSG